MKLDLSFYFRDDVVSLAKELLGKTLLTCFDGTITSGIITETEAYKGIVDKASHSYGGRYTPRTEIMYRSGGTAYVYLCYGVHSLFNVVTNVEGIPDAVLIRSIVPKDGIALMCNRTGTEKLFGKAGNGPGKVSKLLGIHYSHSGESLLADKIWIENNGLIVTPTQIHSSTRIGVQYAEADALLPWRFFLK